MELVLSEDSRNEGQQETTATACSEEPKGAPLYLNRVWPRPGPKMMSPDGKTRVTNFSSNGPGGDGIQAHPLRALWGLVMDHIDCPRGFSPLTCIISFSEPIINLRGWFPRGGVMLLPGLLAGTQPLEVTPTPPAGQVGLQGPGSSPFTLGQCYTLGVERTGQMENSFRQHRGGWRVDGLSSTSAPDRDTSCVTGLLWAVGPHLSSLGLRSAWVLWLNFPAPI